MGKCKYPNEVCANMTVLNGVTYCDSVPCSLKYEIPKQTNADRIRSMTDEELAEFIFSQVKAKCSNHDCVGADFCYYHADMNGTCGSGCEQAIEKWLKADSEV